VLREVLGIVEGEGWFDTTLPFEKTIYLSQGSAQCVLLSRNGQPDTFVKFTELASFAAEAARCRSSCERFPEHTPRFLGYAKRRRIEVLASRAVSFLPLTSRMMLGGSDGAAVGAGFERFFQRMRETPLALGDQQRGHAWFEDLCSYFSGHMLQAVAGPALQRLGAALKTLPALPQHGDLVINNLGLRPGRELVIFDWEDYGAVNLPGLDLFTLENSVHQDLARRSRYRSSQMSIPALDIGRLCDALGLSQDLYRELRLGHALVFRYLKRNYSSEVRAGLDLLINGLATGQESAGSPAAVAYL
jgi:hypothetical protein